MIGTLVISLDRITMKYSSKSVLRVHTGKTNYSFQQHLIKVYKHGHSGVFCVARVTRNTFNRIKDLHLTWYYNEDKNIIEARRNKRKGKTKYWALHKLAFISHASCFGLTSKAAKNIKCYYKTENIFNCYPSNLTQYKWESIDRDKPISSDQTIVKVIKSSV